MFGESLPHSMDGTTIAMLRSWRRWRPRERTIHALIIVSATILLCLHVSAPPPSISRYIYERISVGMTERTVEKIIGTRPGGYEDYCWPTDRLQREWSNAERWSRWGDKYGVLAVGFDPEGRVCSKRLEYDDNKVPRRPDLWPWWKRLVNRTIPSSNPGIIHSPF